MVADIMNAGVIEDFEKFWSECPWDDDLKYAKAVCDQDEFRKLAAKFNLPNKDRKESQGICFLGKPTPRSDFLEDLGMPSQFRFFKNKFDDL
ncbi:hypothetical protein E6C27_scaffold175G00350 [Cucumis melo var. makuwa]|uniref:Uncharacterized protein n=1 Tax=Cucumis melo var. makuwa TaxID=1194695 RepID=A0A5A7U5E9_CUCMM|nr:hypothetical protein E6C27_scaffold175G00350 [Cucumis melo var. makuwa]